MLVNSEHSDKMKILRNQLCKFMDRRCDQNHIPDLLSSILDPIVSVDGKPVFIYTISNRFDNFLCLFGKVWSI